MPIRFEWRHFYRGPAWKEVRARILARAGNCCERCGAPNRTEVLRVFGWWTPPGLKAHLVWSNGTINGEWIIPLTWRVAGPKGIVYHRAYFPSARREYSGHWVSIVLTVAHLNHNPADNRDENLLALCQYCHLTNDSRFHHATRRRTEAARTGQRWLSEEIEKGVLPNDDPPRLDTPPPPRVGSLRA